MGRSFWQAVVQLCKTIFNGELIKELDEIQNDEPELPF